MGLFASARKLVTGRSQGNTSPTLAMRIHGEIGHDLSNIVRRATLKEYAEYLCKYVGSGHKTTDASLTSFYDAEILIALRDAQLPDGWGDATLNVIIPKGVKVSCVNREHNENSLFDMNNFTPPPSWVPVYPSVIEVIKRENMAPLFDGKESSPRRGAFSYSEALSRPGEP